MDPLLVVQITSLCVLGILAVVRIYLQYKSLKLQEKLLVESREYWNSWEKRRKNIAEEVLEDLKEHEKKT